MADCDDGIGALLTELGRPEEAVDLHRRGLGCLPGARRPADRGGDLRTQPRSHPGPTWASTRKPGRHIKSARQVFADAGADDEVSECDLYLAHVASSLGDPDGALELVARARQIWERARPDEAAPGCDLTAGEVLVQAGRCSEAIAPLERALDVYADVCNRGGEAEAALLLAKALTGDGDEDGAHDALARARALFTTMGRIDACDHGTPYLSHVPPVSQSSKTQHLPGSRAFTIDLARDGRLRIVCRNLTKRGRSRLERQVEARVRGRYWPNLEVTLRFGADDLIRNGDLHLGRVGRGAVQRNSHSSDHPIRTERAGP